MVTEEEAISTMTDLFNIIKSGSDEKVVNFVEENWQPAKIANKGLQSLIELIFRARFRFGHSEIHKIYLEEKNKVTALLQDKEMDDWIKFSIGLVKEEKIFIAKFGFMPTHAPAEVLDLNITEDNFSEIIENSISKLVEKDQFSGVVLIAKDDKILFQGTYGYANKLEKTIIDLNTKFNIGSMNKMFTGIAITKLVQEGQLTFEDTVAHILPEYAIDQAEKITIHHLLTHSSGLGNFFTPEYIENRDQYITISDIMKIVEKDKLSFSPGEKFQYSNSGFEVLGAIVEKISGQDYYTYMKNNVFLPSGMKNTDSYRKDEKVENRAQGYTKVSFVSPEPLKEWTSNTSIARIKGSAAGGGYSTANDLLLFREAFFGYKILDKDYVKLITEGKIRPEPENDKIQYSYGMSVHKMGNLMRYGHNGGAPGINSHLSMFLPKEYTVIVLSNYDPPSAERIGRKIEHYILAMEEKK